MSRKGGSGARPGYRVVLFPDPLSPLGATNRGTGFGKVTSCRGLWSGRWMEGVDKITGVSFRTSVAL
jgi:hypothetical protein